MTNVFNLLTFRIELDKYVQGLQSSLTPEVTYTRLLFCTEILLHVCVLNLFIVSPSVLDAESGVGGPALSEPLVRGVRHARPQSGAAGASQHQLPAACCKEPL